MARSSKRSGKKRRTKVHFNANTKKNKWKREKKARQRVSCPQVKEAWDVKKSAKSNMEGCGLAYNVNEVIGVPSTKKRLEKFAKDIQGDVIMKEPGTTSKRRSKSKETVDGGTSSKSRVVQALETGAALESEQNKKNKQLRLSQPEIRYCIYMIEKYGDDYERMARDSKNAFQDTPAQIRRKIETFKSVPIQYNAYLRSKGFIGNNETVPMETS